MKIEVSVAALSDDALATADMSLVQGFGPNGELGNNVIDAKTKGKEQGKAESLLHINPHLPNEFAKYGDRVYIDIGGCGAGTMTYVYEYRDY